MVPVLLPNTCNLCALLCNIRHSIDSQPLHAVLVCDAVWIHKEGQSDENSTMHLFVSHQMIDLSNVSVCRMNRRASGGPHCFVSGGNTRYIRVRRSWSSALEADDLADDFKAHLALNWPIHFETRQDLGLWSSNPPVALILISVVSLPKPAQ